MGGGERRLTSLTIYEMNSERDYKDSILSDYISLR
jgi:hypothetical protein